MTVTAQDAVDAANAAFGRHDGFRALHARGILFKGTFTATPEAAKLTRAAHMQGEEIPATFRFSNGAGDPGVRDSAPSPRGLAVKMYLPDGSRTDLVTVTNELFPTPTPEGFVELLKAQAAGPVGAWRFPAFFARYPRALPVITRTLPTLRPPTSYAAITYYGIHAFRWIDSQGGERYVRYTLLPETPEPRLAPWQARGRARHYLDQEIRERVSSRPVRFTLEVKIGAPGDPVDDPSRGWPGARQRVTVGTFEISAPETGRETGGDVLVFDPTRVTDGIELSGDRVLRFRTDAYAESVARRSGMARSG